MRCRYLAICVFYFVFNNYVNAKDIVYSGEERATYDTILLKHVLSYFPDKNYQVKGYGVYIPKGRSFDLMANNEGIDVMVGSSTKDREALYQPIRFPILKGLIGWRVPLINKNTPELFAHVLTKSQLKQLKPGQFHTWTDTKILEANNIEVIKGSNIQGLFKMLDKKRMDYFPRSVTEIEGDLSNNANLQIMIDPYILIKYPSAYYFYVNKNNHELANDIKQGLELSLVDGSFDKIFQEAFGGVVNRLKLSQRRVFHLNNPLLLDETPVERKELWLNLAP